MTDFLDSATITGVSSLSSVQNTDDVESNTVLGVSSVASSEVGGFTEIATIASTTSLSDTEVTTTETLVVLESYTGLAVGDTVNFVVSSTTITTTSSGGTPPPSTDITYAVSISTTDYDNASWIVAYSYDSSAAITAGTVASFDGDDGLLDIAIA